MKTNLILFMMASLFIVSSCTKAAKANKKIDGEWNVEYIGGQRLDPDETLTFKFEKDKQGKGTFTITSKDQYGTYTEIGNYILEDDNYIYLRWSGDSYAFVLKILDYSKSELKLLDEDDNSVWILIKK